MDQASSNLQAKPTGKIPLPEDERLAANQSTVENGSSQTDAPTGGRSQPNKEQQSRLEDKVVYPSRPTLIVLTIALMVAVFMVALDTNIIGTAIPKITTQFHSLDDIGWYASAYLLTQLAFQASYGKLYSCFSIKWVYMVALLIFEIGSVVCAIAPSSTVFIIERAVAGVGASGIFSGSLNIGGSLVSPRTRPLYISIVSSVYGVAAIAGPLLGGLFTDSKVTWRFCFWVNLPFGALAILIIGFKYSSRPMKNSGRSFQERLMKLDLWGALLLISAMVCLFLALQWGNISYRWSSPRVWGCLLGFGTLMCLFMFLQIQRKEDATIPPRILLQRTVAASSLYTALINMAIDTHIYYLPFYFQSVKSTTAQSSGVHILPYLASMTLTALVTGSCISLCGFYVPFMWLGSFLLTMGSAYLHTLQIQSNPGHWIGYQILAGIGFGFGFQVPYTAIQVVLAADDIPAGNALVVFFQGLGGAIAVSVGQNVLSNTLQQQLSRSPGVDPEAIIGAGATNIKAATSSALLETVLDAYQKAVAAALILPIASAGAAFLCSLTMEWRAVQKQQEAA